MSASFITLNVNGLRDSNKRMALLQWLSHLSLDFVCLQETHVLSAEECSYWFSAYGYLTVTSPGSNHSCGSVILFRPCYSLVNHWIDSDGRFVMAEFTRQDVSFRLACLYAPNRNPHRDDFFATVESLIDPAVPTLVCGDFNAVFDRALDRSSTTSDPSRESTTTLLSLFRQCCIVDIWRVLHPLTSTFSWSKPDGSLSSRIDFIGCPYPWIHRVVSCDIFPCPFSDHSSVLLRVTIPVPLPRGPGRWKLNVSTLKDADFITAVSDFWSSWKNRKTDFSTLQLWWDRGKGHIKRIAINFCKNKR